MRSDSGPITSVGDPAAGPAVEQSGSRWPWLGPYTEAFRTGRAVVVVIFAFVLFVYVGQSIVSEVPSHGDWWADMWRSKAFGRMADQGIWEARFALLKDDGLVLGTRPATYVHWPTMPAALYAMLTRAGFSLIQVRIAPLLVTASAAYFLYVFIRFVAGPRAAWWGLLLYVTAAPVRLLADSFVMMPYDMACRFALFALVAVTASADRRTAPGAWWTGVVAASFTIGAYCSLFGFESVPAMCIFAFAYPIAMAALRIVELRTAIAQALLVPAIGLVTGIVVRLWFIAILPGGFRDDLAELRSAAETRFDDDEFVRSFIAIWSDRLWDYVPVLVVLFAVAIVIGAVRLIGRQREWRPIVVGATVMVAEIAWIVVVQSHSKRHAHTIELLMGSLALAGGWVLAVAERGVTGRRLHAGFLAIAAVGFGVLLTDPGVRPSGNVAGGMDWSRTERSARELYDGLAPDAVLAVPLALRAVGPQFEWFAERPIVYVPNYGLGDLVQRRHVVLIHQKDLHDPLVDAALAAGATVEFETNDYAAIWIDPSLPMPTALDPSG